MRFMILVKADKTTERACSPASSYLRRLGSTGARVKFSGSKRTVTDGPFPDAKHLIAGFWLIQMSSKEEAIEWVKRCPNPLPDTEAEIEIRQVFAASDLGPALTPELREAEERLRAQVAAKR